MKVTPMKMDNIVIANLFLLILYIITLVVYNHAKKEYSGGKVGHVINLITLTIVFLFLSDYMGFFLTNLEESSLFNIKVICRLFALAILSFGGLGFISKKGLTTLISKRRRTPDLATTVTGVYYKQDLEPIHKPEVPEEAFQPVDQAAGDTALTPNFDLFQADESLFAPDEEETRPTLGRYQIIEEIGRGAMGMVYKAKDPKLNRIIAIKTISFREGFSPDEIGNVKERLLIEAETVAKLSHPNIVAIYDVGEEYELLYIAMEYLGERTLERYCKRENLLPIRRSIDIIAQVADALSYAHKNDIVHRDIKPGNIMILPRDEVKVTDFGVARSMAVSKTSTGVVKGTPLFMSPEQISGKKVDGRSDIFSLGVLFYFLLTGQLPFRGDDVAAVIYQINEIKHDPPTKYNPKIFPACEQIIDKALEKDNQRRYQSAESMGEDLRLVGRKIDEILKRRRQD